MQNIVNCIKTCFRVISLIYYSEMKLQKFDNVEAYGKVVQAEFQEIVIRR